MRLEGRVAVVTGAAGGIGRAIAGSLARRRCTLALVDVDAAALAATASALRGEGATVTEHALDVASRDAVRALPDAVIAAHGRADLLVNNAGVALGGTFEQASEADFDWLLEVNLHGLVRTTRVFLPWLRRSDAARIVNLSSVFGIVAPAGQCAYAASKFAVRGFSDALRQELEGTSVGVTVVHPGGVATSIARSARLPAGVPPDEVERRLAAVERMLRMPAARAGEVIVRAVERDAPRVLVGADAKLLALLERIAPVGHARVLKLLAR